ncbi:MAG TPA: type II toxin-antitoxin system RelE/ParE family toxin [Phycisphaerae bacterium]|nr:type II toxin-antitoxin system RelE/ParE family toxin [Phycisphaerae bacterium]
MPKTYVVLYAEGGQSPFLAWVERQPPKVQDKLFDAVSRLEELGHDLRRPEAEYLGKDLYELRVKKGHVNYRPLYFFDDRKDKEGKTTLRRAVIAHGCTKEDAVHPTDIALALERRKKYLANRAAHTYTPPTDPIDE